MKKVLISDKFFDKLIKEKANNCKQFRIKFEYACGEIIGIEFKAEGYNALLRKTPEGIMFMERILEDGEYKIVNTKLVEYADFHENSLEVLEQIMEQLSKQYACIEKRVSSNDAIEIVHVYHTFVNMS